MAAWREEGDAHGEGTQGTEPEKKRDRKRIKKTDPFMVRGEEPFSGDEERMEIGFSHRIPFK
jgi:hypothetical protein